MKENTNYEKAMEAIGQALFEMYGKDTPESVLNLLDNIQDSYVLAEFPASQDYMDLEEAIFCGGSEEKTGSSAYFVPIKYVI